MTQIIESIRLLATVKAFVQDQWQNRKDEILDFLHQQNHFITTNSNQNQIQCSNYDDIQYLRRYKATEVHYYYTNEALGEINEDVDFLLVPNNQHVFHRTRRLPEYAAVTHREIANGYQHFFHLKKIKKKKISIKSIFISTINSFQMNELICL